MTVAVNDGKGLALRLVDAALASVGTDAATTEKDLFSVSVKAGKIVRPRERMVIRAWGTFAATADTKRIRAYFGGTVIADSGAIAANTGHWELEAEVVLTDRLTQMYRGRVKVKTSVATTIDTDYFTQGTLALDEITALIAKVTGQNGAATLNDAVLVGGTVEISD